MKNLFVTLIILLSVSIQSFSQTYIYDGKKGSMIIKEIVEETDAIFIEEDPGTDFGNRNVFELPSFYSRDLITAKIKKVVNKYDDVNMIFPWSKSESGIENYVCILCLNKFTGLKDSNALFVLYMPSKNLLVLTVPNGKKK